MEDGLVSEESCTAEYAAPEVLKYKVPYDGIKSDIYSLGIVFYSILTLKYPEQQNIASESDWKESKVSEECKDLINSMIHSDPNKRPSSEDLLTHNWFSKTSLKE